MIGNNPILHLRRREHRSLGGDRHVCCGDDAAPSGQRVAVRGDDHWCVHSGDRQHQVGPPGSAAVEVVGGGRQSALELGEVTSGAERLALAVDEHGADSLIVLQLVQGGDEFEDGGIVEGIAAVGTGEDDLADAATAGDAYRRLSHRAPRRAASPVRRWFPPSHARRSQPHRHRRSGRSPSSLPPGRSLGCRR